MKSRITLPLFFALATLSAKANISLAFSTATNVGEGWANSAGDNSVRMVWGILVDTQNDGFDGFASITTVPADGGLLITSGASYAPNFSLTPQQTSQTGQLLSLSSGALSDDRLYISDIAMPLVSGDVRISTLNNVVYDANMAGGDIYAIVWFDLTSTGANVPYGTKYGAWYKSGTAPTNGTILPNDGGTTTAPSFMFGAEGTSSLKTASLIFVPEPSAALLGLLGAGALLRRRR